jgi:hypothetical protein
VESRTAAGWGSLNQQSTARRYYRYAFWDPAQGQRRMPLDPCLDAVSLQTGADDLIAQMRGGLLDRLPFPLQDRYELWQLDRDHRPLALLGSTDDESQISSCREQRWQAVSAMQAIDDYSPRDAEPLERLIRQQTGLRQWFRREANGEGVGLDRYCPARLAERVLPSNHFPELLVRDEWSDAKADELSRRWADQLAPWLLQLPGLEIGKRHRLEQAASRQPQMVEAMHRLYPEVLDRRLLNLSRVAARLQRANG